MNGHSARRWRLGAFVPGLVGATILYGWSAGALAADISWSTRSTSGGNFNSPGNWNGGVVPGQNDVAHFSITNLVFAPRIYTVDFTTNPTNQALAVEDDFVTFNLNNFIYTTTAASGNRIGASTNFSGRLTLTNGFMIVPFQSTLSVGSAVNAPGALIVSTGAKLIGNPNLQLGDLANGSLTVQNNGDILTEAAYLGFRAGVTGTATIAGAGSSLVTNQIIVGNLGSGALNLSAGGRVESVAGTLAVDAPVTATVAIDGVNSRWTNSGSLTVGTFGQAALDVTAGGEMQNNGASTNVAVASGSSGDIRVDGANSRWTNAGVLTLGGAGTATLSVTAGGLATSTKAILGDMAAGAGAATVSGAGSQWNLSDRLTIGDDGVGSLTIQAGGSVTGTDALLGFGVNSTGSATVTGPGATWTNSGVINVGFSSKPASLVISSGAHVQSGQSNLGVSNVSHGSAALANPGTSWTCGFFNVGLGGRGDLSIESGAVFSTTGAAIAAISGSSGSATLTDAGSSWTNTGDFSVGDGGTGLLNVSADAILTSAGDFTVGGSGNGTLNVTTGGQLLNTVRGIVGDAASGVATVSGANSQWNMSNRLTVGNGGDGTLNVLAGGRVSDSESLVGLGANSHAAVNVSGAGSMWSTAGILNLGFSTNLASVAVSAGGHVDSGSCNVGIGAGSHGAVTVTGGGSSWSSGPLSVGLGGDGQLSISSGGGVSSSSAVISAASGSTGQATVAGAGSQWTIAGNLGVGGDAVRGGLAMLRIQPGAVVAVGQTLNIFTDSSVRLEGGTLDAQTITLQPVAFFQWTSGTLHFGTFNGNLSNVAGTLAPGHSPGAANIVGNYAQSASAALQIEIAGLAPGAQFDRVDVTGLANLNGALNVTLLNNFIPSIGNSFEILRAVGGLSGSFSSINLPDLSAFNRGWQINSTATAISLQVVSLGSSGDYDHDGDVDGADLLVWQRGGSLSPNSPADLVAWRTNFGFGAVTPAATAVPEPSSRLLFSFTLAVAAAAKTRRRSVSRSDARSVALTTARTVGAFPRDAFQPCQGRHYRGD